MTARSGEAEATCARWSTRRREREREQTELDGAPRAEGPSVIREEGKAAKHLIHTHRALYRAEYHCSMCVCVYLLLFYTKQG